MYSVNTKFIKTCLNTSVNVTSLLNLFALIKRRLELCAWHKKRKISYKR